MHAAVDPALLGLPDDFLTWIDAFEAWEHLLTESPLSASCPAKCQRELYALWSDYNSVASALAAQACPLDVHDLLRVLDALLGRLDSGPLPAGREVVLEGVTCFPLYGPPDMDPRCVEAVVEHLGCVAMRRVETQENTGVITRDSSWSHPSEDVAVEGNIALRQLGDGPLEEPEPSSAAVRELLRVWREPYDVMVALAHEPCQLMSYIEFGVRAYAVGVMGHEGSAVQLTFGSDFRDSVEQMKYARHRGRAKALLRALAMIATGRSADVPGHREREAPAGNSPIVTDDDGYEVERSYLSQKSPNAHRLFWVRRPVPHVLNVGGHESRPLL